MKTACITGITGQTGSYLAELLLNKGYKVYGLNRRTSTFNTSRIDHIYKDPHISKQLELVYGDMSDYSSLASFVGDAKPDIFFNLAAQSHVRVSFDIPEYTMDIVATGALRCLEAIRKNSPTTRFLNASTSELFGDQPAPQNEKTPFKSRSPYACAKLAAHSVTVNYREAYNLFAVNSISFNHESPRRTENFVTRKITRAATRIYLGLQEKLYLGNLDSKRDWSDARDVVRGMYKIITANEPDDFCIATGETRSVKEFLETVFSKLNMDWKDYVEFDPRYLRPTEVPELCGDASKIKETLGWQPEYSFDDLVQSMIDHDLDLAYKERVTGEEIKI